MPRRVQHGVTLLLRLEVGAADLDRLSLGTLLLVGVHDVSHVPALAVLLLSLALVFLDRAVIHGARGEEDLATDGGLASIDVADEDKVEVLPVIVEVLLGGGGVLREGHLLNLLPDLLGDLSLGLGVRAELHPTVSADAAYDVAIGRDGLQRGPILLERLVYLLFAHLGSRVGHSDRHARPRGRLVRLRRQLLRLGRDGDASILGVRDSVAC
mmetsp:Transcript_6752/g.23574  ORF Transcript_6752/g.23574 Transcript_6752/m.23574 type:complete len:212 (-) Transcript_6752:84-719(-)